MTVKQLIRRLKDMEPEAEVRLAFQPSWPLQFKVGDVVECEGPGGYDDDYETPEQDGDGSVFVYITEGGHPDDSPYAPKSVFGN